MDIENLVERARDRFAHESARKTIKEKYLGRMVFAHAGGLWRAGPELQVLLSTCAQSKAVILDLYDNPVEVDVEELMTMSQQRWQEQMNAWLIEHQESNKKR